MCAITNNKHASHAKQLAMNISAHTCHKKGKQERETEKQRERKNKIPQGFTRFGGHPSQNEPSIEHNAATMAGGDELLPCEEVKILGEGCVRCRMGIHRLPFPLPSKCCTLDSDVPSCTLPRVIHASCGASPHTSTGSPGSFIVSRWGNTTVLLITTSSGCLR